MNIDIKPGIKIALLGGIGYAVGRFTSMNPKQMALIWAIAELSIQVFTFIDRYYHFNLPQSLIATLNIVPVVSSAIQLGLIENTTQAIFMSLGISFFSSFCDGFVNEFFAGFSGQRRVVIV